MGSRRNYIILMAVLFLLSAAYRVYYHTYQSDIIWKDTGYYYMLAAALVATPLFYGSLGAFLSAFFIKYTILPMPSPLRVAGIVLGLFTVVIYLLFLWGYLTGSSPISYPYSFWPIRYPQCLLATGVFFSLGIQRKNVA